ncbi:MAG: hypothetical protein DA328_00235 [Nitrososphaeraceae archaeon]|nr:hypothetical protein [Nitrososphaeraceae archaeon]
MTDIRNKIIVITKTDKHVDSFEEKISKLGGTLLKLPTTIVVTKSDDEINYFISELTTKNKYQYCIFLSPKAVDILVLSAKKLNKFKVLVDYLNTIEIISVGPKTSATLEDYGIHVTMTPDTFSSYGIFQLFSLFRTKNDDRKNSIIIPRSERGDDFLKKNLSDLGYHVNEFFLYTVVTGEVVDIWNDYLTHLKRGKIYSVIFTSPSSVQSFFELSERLDIDFKNYVNTINSVISIGPLTSKTLKKYGIHSIIEPEQHSLDGIFAVLYKNH